MSIIHAMNMPRNMPEQSQAALTEEGLHAGNTSAWQYLTVNDVILPLDAVDAPEASQMERVQAAFLFYVGGPSFTAV